MKIQIGMIILILMTIMTPMTDNDCVVDLGKAQWCTFYYKNQYDNVRKRKPTKPTVSGCLVKDEMHINGKQTMLEYATEHKLLDVWTPICRVVLTANKSLRYTGDKAKSIWKEWNRRIFKK